jgi:YesN/AraC family two-component response regulator
LSQFCERLYLWGGRVISEATGIEINDFIEKPFTAKTFEESLSRLLEKQGQKSKGPCETEHTDQWTKEF